MLKQIVIMGCIKSFLCGFFICTPAILYANDLVSGVNEISGQWRVISVRLDTLATTNAATTEDDPHYVGRKVSFDNDGIHSNIDSTATCSNAHYAEQRTLSLDKLLQQSSGKRYSEPRDPKAEDFGLTEKDVTPVLIDCRAGKFGPQSETTGNWVALIKSNTLITNWYDNSYLIMQRIGMNEKIQPSFHCEGTLNQTERTICADNELASWDNSVNEAYKTLLMQQQKIMPDDKATLTKIKATQMNWLKKRNGCKSDTDCIEKVMKDRVDAITQQFM